MKRFMHLIIVVTVTMLVAVAPASAVTLHGQWTGGVANGLGGSWFDGTLQAEPTEYLGVSGLVNITTYPTSTDVASLLVITADPGVPPFPVKMNSQSFFAWGPAVQSGDVWTVHGTVKSPPYIRAGLTWEADLVVNTGSGDLTMTITTTGSYWEWQTWTLCGELY